MILRNKKNKKRRYTLNLPELGASITITPLTSSQSRDLDESFTDKENLTAGIFNPSVDHVGRDKKRLEALDIEWEGFEDRDEKGNLVPTPVNAESLDYLYENYYYVVQQIFRFENRIKSGLEDVKEAELKNLEGSSNSTPTN